MQTEECTSEYILLRDVVRAEAYKRQLVLRLAAKYVEQGCLPDGCCNEGVQEEMVALLNRLDRVLAVIRSVERRILYVKRN